MGPSFFGSAIRAEVTALSPDQSTDEEFGKRLAVSLASLGNVTEIVSENVSIS